MHRDYAKQLFYLSVYCFLFCIENISLKFGRHYYRWRLVKVRTNFSLFTTFELLTYVTSVFTVLSGGPHHLVAYYDKLQKPKIYSYQYPHNFFFLSSLSNTLKKKLNRLCCRLNIQNLIPPYLKNWREIAFVNSLNSYEKETFLLILSNKIIYLNIEFSSSKHICLLKASHSMCRVWILNQMNYRKQWKTCFWSIK